jgi:hypothetical protein
MFTCGACGSGVSAQEKYKNLKDGSVNKYIYYGCTKFKDKECKEGYIEEKVLMIQLLEIIDKIDLDKSGLKKKLEIEIERHKKFHSRLGSATAVSLWRYSDGSHGRELLAKSNRDLFIILLVGLNRGGHR